MTFVLTINGPESIWLLADRRLSYGAKRAPRDDGCKVMCLETSGDVALLGYAGLGATALGTEPSEWMSRVLRGRRLSLEKSLGVLADAIKAQIAPHLVKTPGEFPAAHCVLATAIVSGMARFYSIDLQFAPDRSGYWFRLTRPVVGEPGEGRPRPPRLAVAGSGREALASDTQRLRTLLSIMRAHHRGRVTSAAVAEHLARLNWEIHRETADGSVGPNCIVAWRYRQGGLNGEGGAHAYFTGTQRDEQHGDPLPIVANGIDLKAVVRVIQSRALRSMTAMLDGHPVDDEADVQQMNAELDGLPDTPDERLR